METTEISFVVSEKTKRAFELALYFSDKDKNEVFESFVREYAAKVAKALNDVNDFEILFSEIETAVQYTEGDFGDFYQNQLIPLLQGELNRRKKILEEM